MFFFTKISSRLIVAATIVTAYAGISAEQEVVPISFDNVFVPKGFDSNDSVEIIISGELPNTCYLRPHGETKIINDHIKVEMKATKLTGDDVVCISAIVPFAVSVPLGQLEVGSYEILVNAGAASEKNSTIAIDRPSSNSINNFNYANVISAETLGAAREILIKGVHPSSCMEIDRVEIVPNGSFDTYSVLPIIKQTQPICDRMTKPFSYKLTLPQAQKSQELVHIRKIDGTALNHLVKTAGNRH